MEMLLQLTALAAAVGVAAALFRRGRKPKRAIETGSVSPSWLIEQRARRRDRGAHE
jgi:hypothetical protein